jgi:hypothetical protein
MWHGHHHVGQAFRALTKTYKCIAIPDLHTSLYPFKAGHHRSDEEELKAWHTIFLDPFVQKATQPGSMSSD